MSSLTLRPTAPYLPRRGPAVRHESKETAHHPGEGKIIIKKHLNSFSSILSGNLLHECFNASAAPHAMNASWTFSVACKLTAVRLLTLDTHTKSAIRACSPRRQESVQLCFVLCRSYKTRTAQPESVQLCVYPLVTFILLLSVLRQVWQSEWGPCLCWVSMSDGSSQNVVELFGWRDCR